jgi:hypothetical protein
MKKYEMFYSEIGYQNDWIKFETDKEIEAYIRSYLAENYWVCDCDGCGDDVFEFVIKSEEGTRMFSVEHSWWIVFDPDFRVENEFYVTEVESVKFPFPSKNRDWLILKSTR